MSDLKSITREEVSKHFKPNDLWIIINDQVYDVSKFDDHPGSKDQLVEVAGTDASSGFEMQEHSASARRQMKQFLIGKLDKGEEEETIDTKSKGPSKRAGKVNYFNYNKKA